jgi:hypothetical protein
MTTVTEVENAEEHLPSNDLSQFCNGRLNSLVNESRGEHKTGQIRLLLLFFLLTLGACGLIPVNAVEVVNSLQDVQVPAQGQVTLRLALAQAASGESIVFDPTLNGCTIELSIVGEEHSALVGELMGGSNAPSGYISYLIGYYERDYGRSALYARKDVVIDASALPLGITIKWGGGDANPARVLAVYGDLTLKNVSITGGRSVSVALPNPSGDYPQKSTRARGGGLAVWGVAHLEKCRLYDNTCFQVWNMPVRETRESGVFGGGIYADIVEISDCVISGNSVAGAGVSGGGVFAVGGRDANKSQSTIDRTAITGNCSTGIFAYGGGVYSDGGGIGKLKTLKLQNCTIAGNRVGIYGPTFLYGTGYWRGGGVYMSNGYMILQSCTVVGNEVYGVPRTNELGKLNLAGGIAATVGNAHAVESMTIGHCIIAGNTVHKLGGEVYHEDIFTGSLFEFISKGYNRIGTINFSQILVPIGQEDWYSLCRKHYPKKGDRDGISLADVLDLTNGITRSADIISVGADAPARAVLRYAPKGNAIDQVLPWPDQLNKTRAEYVISPGATNNFLKIILGRIENRYNLSHSFASSFTTNFEAFLATVDSDNIQTNGVQPYTDTNGVPILTLAATKWFYSIATWPSQLSNYPYIEFWHRLDSALAAENITGMGPELLGDDAWQALFNGGYLIENTGIDFSIWTEVYLTEPSTVDQTGATRPVNGLGDIGAIERQPLSGEYTDFDGDGIPDHLDEDDDNDGLTDSGEAAIGTDSKNTDSDGDRVRDRDEVIAGTNPLGINSLLRFTGLTLSDDQVALQWSSASNRTYSLWWTTNLTANIWERIDSSITSTVPANVHTAEAAPGCRFFKVIVE